MAFQITKPITTPKISNISRQLLNYNIVEPLDVKQHPFIILGHKVDGNTLSPKPPTTANTMEVVFRLCWKVIINHKRDLLDINTTGQISCYKHTRRTRPKLSQDGVPGVLGGRNVERTEEEFNVYYHLEHRIGTLEV